MIFNKCRNIRPQLIKLLQYLFPTSEKEIFVLRIRHNHFLIIICWRWRLQLNFSSFSFYFCAFDHRWRSDVSLNWPTTPTKIKNSNSKKRLIGTEIIKKKQEGEGENVNKKKMSGSTHHPIPEFRDVSDHFWGPGQVVNGSHEIIRPKPRR